MAISLQISVVLWISIWISLDIHAFTCCGSSIQGTWITSRTWLASFRARPFHSHVSFGHLKLKYSHASSWAPSWDSGKMRGQPFSKLTHFWRSFWNTATSIANGRPHFHYCGGDYRGNGGPKRRGQVRQMDHSAIKPTGVMTLTRRNFNKTCR